MFGRFRAVALTAAGAAIALTATACGSTPAPGGASNGPAVSGDPTVTLMVGGINKQIYLPYQLAQDLGFYKKYGVNVQLSTEQAGGVGAEDAMASGQVDMAGAWYEHTIDFQQKGKAVEDIVQLSGAPGERIMCGNSTKITSPAQWKGKTLGVTDLGSGTDELTQYLATRYHLTTKDYTRVAAGDGDTMIAALQRNRIACGMTTQPTVAAIEQQKAGYMAFDLATTSGVQKWLGGFVPTAGVLALTSWVNQNKATAQKVVDALVATMHWINTHSAAQIAAEMPADYVSNSLVTKTEYISALAQDKTQFLPDGIMPADGPTVVEAIGKTAGTITGPVNLPVTYTNSFAAAANKLEGYNG
ncbi:MAG TPA: ABC transporter substrate-binding protein [Trebonia sp.]